MLQLQDARPGRRPGPDGRGAQVGGRGKEHETRLKAANLEDALLRVASEEGRGRPAA